MKELCAVELGGKDRDIRSEDCVTHKVWMITTKDNQDALSKDDNTNSVLVKDY